MAEGKSYRTIRWRPDVLALALGGILSIACSPPSDPHKTQQLASAPQPPVTATPASLPAGEAAPRLTATEQQIFDATNAERTRQGLTPLAHDAVLSDAARGHSADMLARGYFSHTSPDGDSAGDRIARRHRRLVGVSAENIWTGTGYGQLAPPELARKIVDSWMSSRSHRANILNPGSTHLGVGVVLKGREVRATQNFATVRGWIAEPVPEVIPRGSRLKLSPVSGPQGPALKADLWFSSGSVRVAGPFDFPGTVLDVSPGRYQLRYYFPEGAGRFSIHPGPSLEVR